MSEPKRYWATEITDANIGMAKGCNFVVPAYDYDALQQAHDALKGQVDELKRENETWRNSDLVKSVVFYQNAMRDKRDKVQRLTQQLAESEAGHDVIRKLCEREGAHHPEVAINRLKAELAQVTAERDRLKDDPDYRQCCELRVKAEQERDYNKALFLLVMYEGVILDSIPSDLHHRMRTLLHLPFQKSEIDVARAVVERGKP